MKNDNTILITGVTGFVGQNLLRALKNSKYNILTPNSKSLDLTNLNNLESYINEKKPSIIVHLACKVPRRKYDYFEEYRQFLINQIMFSNILRVSKDNHIRKVILIGSSIIGEENFILNDRGLMDKLKLPEFGSPKFFYKLSKLIELATLHNSTLSETKYSIIIAPNLYGKFDNFNLDESHIVSKLISLIYEGKNNKINELVISGTGNEEADFVYVDDLVELILEEISKLHVGELVILSSFNRTKIKELAIEISKCLEFEGKISFNEQKYVTKKLTESVGLDLKTYPSKTSLVSGIEETCFHYANSLEMIKK